jgi:protein TonB
VLIDESGNVAERSVIKSSRIEFERPALDAVRRWKFKPAKKSGTAVKARLVLPIQFSFEG